MVSHNLSYVTLLIYKQLLLYSIYGKNGYQALLALKGGKTMFQISKALYGPNSPRTIRFPDEFFEHLCQLAQENGISLNRFVLECCKYAVEHMEEEQE